MHGDFHLFQDMMETGFGKRFHNLFRSPAWSGCAHEDFKYPLNVRNVKRCVNDASKIRIRHAYD